MAAPGTDTPGAAAEYKERAMKTSRLHLAWTAGAVCLLALYSTMAAAQAGRAHR